MADVVTIRRKPDQSAASARVGMMVFLAAWGMMFAGLLFTFVFVRIQAEVWPPPDAPPIPVLWPALSTAALLCSMALVAFGQRAIRLNRSTTLAASWTGAVVLGVAFLALQVVFFLECRSLGLKGSFGGTFLMYVFFQGLSVLAGLPGLLVVASRARAGRYGALAHVGVGLWALYWYAIGVAWMLMYVGACVF